MELTWTTDTVEATDTGEESSKDTVRLWPSAPTFCSALCQNLHEEAEQQIWIC